jgi:hypothetical protein
MTSSPLRVVETLSSGSWQGANLALPDEDTQVQLTGIDCAAVGTCEAVGFDNYAFPVIESLSQGTWIPAILPLASGVDSVELSGVACVASESCIAAGVSSASQPVAEVQSTTQTIEFAWTPLNPAFGESVQLYAFASSGIPVSFTVDASSHPGACRLTGAATVHFTGVGQCTIDANQMGDAGIAPAAQVQQSVTISKASTTTSLRLSSTQLAVGTEQSEVVSFSVQAAGTTSRPSGAVVIRASATVACKAALKGGKGTCSLRASELSAGRYRFSATHEGTSLFASSMSSTELVTIRR